MRPRAVASSLVFVAFKDISNKKAESKKEAYDSPQSEQCLFSEAPMRTVDQRREVFRASGASGFQRKGKKRR